MVRKLNRKQKKIIKFNVSIVISRLQNISLFREKSENWVFWATLARNIEMGEGDEGVTELLLFLIFVAIILGSISFLFIATVVQ